MAFGRWPMPELTARELRGTMGSIVLLDLMGGVALLLWGLFMACALLREAWGDGVGGWNVSSGPMGEGGGL
jgi:hypothetical protein